MMCNIREVSAFLWKPIDWKDLRQYATGSEILDASRNPTSPSRNDAQRRNCLDQGSGQHTEEGSPGGGLLEHLGGLLALPDAS
eukprot:9302182-Pyramimonas_sp.AAC.1